MNPAEERKNVTGVLKKAVERAVYWRYARTEQEILKQIKGKATVSFDVFDTLIKRDVAEPKDVFALIETRLQDEKNPGIEHFSELRLEAEQFARKVSRKREVTLEDIYEHMPVDDKQRFEVMRLECQVEIEVSTPNIPMKRVYDACVREGKKILLISDMYLPSEIIWKILQKNGYDIGCLYVSCEVGRAKREGGLFSYVQKAENLITDSWIHIGDAIFGDFLSPKRLGIKTVLINRNPRYNKYVDRKLLRRNQSYLQLNHFIDIHISRYTDPYEQIGYAVLGPLLYGFSCWLEREIPQEESIVFLAREGALLQRAFEIISERASIYLHISRHAAKMVYLDYIKNLETVLKDGIFGIKKYSTQGLLAKSYGLSDGEIHKVFLENDLKEKAIACTLEMEKDVITAIWPVAKRHVEGQYSLLQEHLEQLCLTNKNAIIDIGWSGSIQALLNECRFILSGKTCCWDGYYMGCFRTKDTSAYKNIKKRGFLFDENHNLWLHDGITDSVPFFEFLFLSTEGTTKSYGKDETGIVHPVLGQPENSESANTIILSLQDAGIQFVQDFHKSPSKELLTVDAMVSACNYQSLARVPSLSTLSLFSQFNSYDEHVFGFGSEYSLGYYLLHPRHFVEEIAKRPGKVWFLKSVFRIPLPYNLLLNMARKILVKLIPKGTR